MQTQSRPLFVIAREIRADWKTPYSGAVPYLWAMSDLGGINDMYGLDSARSVVLYFLANANTWKGETARRVKAELSVAVDTGDASGRDVFPPDDVPRLRLIVNEESIETRADGSWA